jgi:hypothetical protein
MMTREKDPRWRPKRRQFPPPKPQMMLPHSCEGVQSSVDLRISISGVWNNITTGGPFLCLEVANDGQGNHPSDNDVKHPSFSASTGNASQSPIYSMPAGRGYKRVTESRLFLRKLVDLKEASVPVKILEEQEACHCK